MLPRSTRDSMKKYLMDANELNMDTLSTMGMTVREAYKFLHEKIVDT